MQHDCGNLTTVGITHYQQNFPRARVQVPHPSFASTMAVTRRDRDRARQKIHSEFLARSSDVLETASHRLMVTGMLPAYGSATCRTLSSPATENCMQRQIGEFEVRTWPASLTLIDGTHHQFCSRVRVVPSVVVKLPESNHFPLPKCNVREATGPFSISPPASV